MPDYGGGTATRGVTIHSGIMPTYAATTLPGGALSRKLLATCPSSKAWEVKTIWLQNNSLTATYAVSLSRVSATWIGSPNDPLLYVFFNLSLTPGQFLVLNATLGLKSGDALWGYVIDNADTAATTAALNIHVDGLETG